MNAFIPLSAISFLLLLGIGFIVLVQRSQIKKLQSIGVDWLQHFRLLVRHLQRHRGLTTRYLSGENGLQREISEIETLVAADLRHISMLSGAIKSEPEWDLITADWTRLTTQYKSLGIENNLRQHTFLVKSVLNLASEVSASHSLKNLSGLPFSWWQLFMLAEFLGQTRALSVIAASALSRAELPNKVKRQLTLVKSEALALYFENGTLHDERFAFFESYMTTIDALLQSDFPPLSVRDYYECASDAQDQLYTLLESDLKRAHAALMP